MKQSEIWVPRWIYNERTVRNNFEDFWDTDVYLYDKASTRNAFWSRPGSIQAKCEVNLADYPFDTQKCKLTFQSWMHDARHIKLSHDTARFSEKALLGMSTEEYRVIGVLQDTVDVMYEG